jgi:hypothetical protein
VAFISIANYTLGFGSRMHHLTHLICSYTVCHQF